MAALTSPINKEERGTNLYLQDRYLVWGVGYMLGTCLVLLRELIVVELWRPELWWPYNYRNTKGHMYV